MRLNGLSENAQDQHQNKYCHPMRTPTLLGLEPFPRLPKEGALASSPIQQHAQDMKELGVGPKATTATPMEQRAGRCPREDMTETQQPTTQPGELLGLRLPNLPVPPPGLPKLTRIPS